jgi:quercetin dioxygenase-like cupin family protein
MKTKTKLLIGAAALSSVIVGLVWATPIVKLASPVLATGNDNLNIETHGVFTTSGGEFKANLKTEGPSTIFVQDTAFSPGGHTGWHSHPGILTLALISGTVEWFNGNCEKTTYNAGDAWTEGSQASLLPQPGYGYGQRTRHGDVHHRPGCGAKNRQAGSEMRRRPRSRLI